VIKIAAAIRLRKQIRQEWLLALSGLLSVAFGGLLAVMPIPGIIGMMWAVGVYGLAFGTMLLVLSARLKRAGEPPAEVESQAPPRAA
jgi:uncharacterized membrane protein HdeD (DUF308 family)